MLGKNHVIHVIKSRKAKGFVNSPCPVDRRPTVRLNTCFTFNVGICYHLWNNLLPLFVTNLKLKLIYENIKNLVHNNPK